MLALYNVPMPFINAGHRRLHLVREPLHAFILSNASIITRTHLSTSQTLILALFLTNPSPADNTWHARGTVSWHVKPVVTPLVVLSVFLSLSRSPLFKKLLVFFLSVVSLSPYKPFSICVVFLFNS